MRELTVELCCPNCKGEKAFRAIACSGNHGCISTWTDCRLCGGIGSVSEETLRRYLDGRKLRAERIKNGETLYQVAQHLGVKPSDVSRIESGGV